MGALTCGRLETYADDVGQLRNHWPQITQEIEGFTGVAQVVEWLAARSGERAVLDMIGMDEFEYDFLVQVGPGGSWLAFGVT